MKLVFRDELGYVQVEVNEYGVSFLDGQAIFESSNGQVYAMDVSSIVYIGKL